jgi:hypothetical protein
VAASPSPVRNVPAHCTAHYGGDPTVQAPFLLARVPSELPKSPSRPFYPRLLSTPFNPNTYDPIVEGLCANHSRRSLRPSSTSDLSSCLNERKPCPRSSRNAAPLCCVAELTMPTDSRSPNPGSLPRSSEGLSLDGRGILSGTSAAAPPHAATTAVVDQTTRGRQRLASYVLYRFPTSHNTCSPPLCLSATRTAASTHRCHSITYSLTFTTPNHNAPRLKGTAASPTGSADGNQTGAWYDSSSWPLHLT